LVSIQAEIKDIVLTRGVGPVIELALTVNFPTRYGDATSYVCQVYSIQGILTVRHGDQWKRLNPLVFPSTLAGNSTYPQASFSAFCFLTFQELEELEKIRAGGELSFGLFSNRLDGLADIEGETPRGHLKKLETISIEVSGGKKAPKHDWLSQLSGIDFRRYRTFEFPMVDGKDELQLTESLDDAWKKYYAGEYADTIVACRRIYEDMKKKLKERKFVKDSDPNEIDFKKILNGDKTATHFESLFEATWGLTQPGAHIGRIVGKADADLILMNTHAVVKYLVSNIR